MGRAAPSGSEPAVSSGFAGVLLPTLAQLGGWLQAIFWARGGALVVALLVGLLAAAGYQFPLRFTESLARLPSPVEVRGGFSLEESPRGAQRWTVPRFSIRLPGMGQAPALIGVTFFGGAEAGAGRPLTVRAGEYLLAETELRPDWQELRLLLPPGLSDNSGTLTLQFETTPLNAPADPRPLGVSLHSLEVRTLPQGAQPLPGGRIWQVVGIALGLFWALRLAGLGTRLVITAVLALAGILYLGLAGLWPSEPMARLLSIQTLNALGRTLPYVLVLALVLRAVGSRVATGGGTRAFVAVRCAMLLIVILRLGGLLHPQFVPIDHVLRANQLLNLAAGRPEVVIPALEQQHEWGTREPIPYSLLTYYLLVPLAGALHTVDAVVFATKLVTVLLDATIPLLLWLLLCGGPRRDAGAAWAALVYAALPIGYLFFHDGSFPTTIGLWLVLAALVVLRQALAGGWLRRAGAALAVALALGAYVTHIAFVPFLGAVTALSLFMLGEGVRRREGLALAGSGAAGLCIGWILFYGGYTLTLIQRTLPAYLGLMVSEGAVGRDAERFFDTPLNSFGEHLMAHFRLWPALLAAVALAILIVQWRGRFITHLGIAYLALLAATSFAELWFGLWNKHIYFVAPGVALLAGLGLSWLWQRGRAGRLVSVMLLSALFWESLAAWGGRVLWYSLPRLAL